MNKSDAKLGADRPKFLTSFIEAVAEESKIRNWRAIFPAAFLLCAMLAAVVAYFIPAEFWSDQKRELAVSVLVGLLIFNGLILALGWSAFGRIYDVLLRDEFGEYLMRNGLLNDYILQITFMHIFQIGAVIVSAIGLVTLLLDNIPLVLSRIIFGMVVLFTMYAIKQAIDAVTAMNDLVWQSAFFEVNKPASGNVVGMTKSH